MPPRRRLLILIACIALLAVAPVAMPQQGNAIQPSTTNEGKALKTSPSPTTTASSASEEDDRVIIEDADYLQSESGQGPHHLRGNVRIVARGVKLFCDAADYTEEPNTMKASGHLRIVDKEAEITGDLLEADLDREVMVVTGNVQVIAQKQPESQKVKAEATPVGVMSRDKGPRKQTIPGLDGTNPGDLTLDSNASAKAPGKGKPLPAGEARYRRTVITCERIEYYYATDQKRMVATPRVKAVQEERTVFADQAVFDDQTRLITLTGNVLIQGKDGDEMRCEKAVIHVDDEWVKADKVSGVTLRKRKSEAISQPTPPVTNDSTVSPVAPTSE